MDTPFAGLWPDFPRRSTGTQNLVFFDEFTLDNRTRTYDGDEEQLLQLRGNMFGILGFLDVDNRWR